MFRVKLTNLSKVCSPKLLQPPAVLCRCPSILLRENIYTKAGTLRDIPNINKDQNSKDTIVLQYLKKNDYMHRKAIRRLMRQSRQWLKNKDLNALKSPLINSLLWSSHDPEKKYNKPYRDVEEDDEREKSELPGDDPEKSGFANLVRVMIFTSLIAFSLVASYQDNIPETSWSLFLRLMLQTGEVEKLEVSSHRDKVYVYLANGAIINGKEVFGYGPHYSFSINNIHSFEEKLKTAQLELGIKPNEFIPIKYNPLDTELMSTIFNVAVIIGLFGLVSYFAFGRRSGMSGIGGNPFTSHTRAKALIIQPGSKKGIKFAEVAGMHEAKEEVREFVDYLQYPTRFKELGARIPKGALLCGPPGTGKTLLAKAVATESAVPFLSMAGSDFVEMFSGVGSARVRDLFAQARKRAPCIVYIDEIDAIGRSRRSSSSVGGNSEQENTLNQLLVEMDGMNTIEGVVMLASTNRPDILDQALMRPGRFDRTITIDLPTLPERQSIFEIYLKKLKLEDSIRSYSKSLAELTPGKSGADIANICNEAALHAARLNENAVDDKNFDYAIERVIAGIKKNSNPLNPEERRTVAYHEAGHTVVNWMLKHTEPVLKVSIVPRTSTPLGYSRKFPLDIKLHTNEQLFDMMCASLGGRVAEAIIFNRVTTGAEDDLKMVTNMAYQQIVTFGMNPRIGPISLPLRKPGEMSKKPYSDKMANLIDEEASSLIAKAHVVAKELLLEHRDKLEKVAEALLDHEVLDHDALVKLIGSPPHGDKRETFYKYAFQPRGATDENNTIPA
ncbi:paraplegin-like [Hydractinia symbiolongicarpus]|uniref:paraplegin-like n=1 Tax=Hydractinia symbiolongicarpus TaxID=13093 RepID=UPI002551A5B7|nr:paraplegin-like [Hydractinia symbiolongicarpus]XP_057291941.1 paraplegin-like [Hydractinia symbiolongicarpus]XP_057291942.1 paraplegin-like [Hydractinia symbiolongicarpus]